jgi:hypothetical protein
MDAIGEELGAVCECILGVDVETVCSLELQLLRILLEVCFSTSDKEYV